MGLNIVRFACSLAALLIATGSGLSASACDQCGGGASHHSSYSVGVASAGCSSCGGRSSGRCSTCTNGPSNKCRTCARSPEPVDCCNGCGTGRTVFGCGWRTWDFLGYWTCGGGCGTEGGCGEIYRGDYASDPPDCCDPCDGYGNFVGPGHGGYRARYNPSHYVGGTGYDYSSDYTYTGGESFQDFKAPAYARTIQWQKTSAPSRVISTARRPSKMPYHPQARQIPNSNYR